MNREFALGFCVLALIGATAGQPAHAAAGRIALDMRPASRLQNGQVEAVLSVTHRGNEPARAWHVEAMLPDRAVSSAVHDTLQPDATSTVRIPMGNAPDPAGLHTLVFKMRYTDVNGRPFSALTHIPLVTAGLETLDGPLAIRLDSGRMRKRQRIHVALHNRGPTQIETRVRLFLPDELRCVSEQEISVKLAPGEKAEKRFAIRNAGALPGSQYAMVATADYRLDHAHWSAASTASLRIEPLGSFSRARQSSLAVALVLLALWTIAQFRTRPLFPAAGAPAFQRGFEFAALATATAFIAWHLYPPGWFMNTLATGGDIPAHSYMASQLKDSLFSSGRIVAWSHGWWAGFPMFQYYFPLPYLAVVALDLILPFNIAFKLVSVCGLLSLPVCAFVFARATRLPRPIPVLMAVAMIPFLFTRAHVMWGVNAYSTLAGMIANSLGFSIMLLFLASAWRDAEAGRFRARTVLLLGALIAAHFFTTLVAVAAVALLPLLAPLGGFRKSFRTLLGEGLLGFLLMAWWLVPLIAKIDCSVDFGQDWDVRLHRTLPGYSLALAPFMLVAILASLGNEIAPIFGKTRANKTMAQPGKPSRNLKAVLLLQWMLLVSVALFLYGSRLASVFDNIRLWPFFFFACLALAATGLGWLLHRRKAPECAVAATLILALTLGVDQPNDVRAWARWNYEGVEAKPAWPVLEDLVLPLDGTPGRLANDLHPDNNRLGSTRIFECVPHLIDKPVLEGGIVNSAAGSMFAYRIQGETSRSSAGYPNIVKPATFNFERANRHLELFNVKHFIARWEPTQTALENSPDWRLVAARDPWRLYEALAHDGGYVFVPSHRPIGVRLEAGPAGRPWKQAGLDWMYAFAALDTPFALLDPDEPAPDLAYTVSEPEFRAHLAAMENATGAGRLAFEPATRHAEIVMREFSDRRIRFRTDSPGEPHIVKVTHFPNWHVKGARKIYRVTPCFMLVYPSGRDVELIYGRVASDRLGLILSWLGVVALIAIGMKGFKAGLVRNP